MRRYHTLLTVTLLSTLLLGGLPVPTMAAELLRVDDSVAGLGLNVEMYGGPASAQLALLIANPLGESQTLSFSTDSKGAANVSVPGRLTEQAGTYAISALRDRSPFAGPLQVEVKPAGFDARMSDVQSADSYVMADGRSQATIAVIMRDAFGNPLAGRPVALISSRAEDIISPLGTQTDTKGTQLFSLSTTLAGTIQLRGIDLLTGTALTSTATIRAEQQAIGGYYSNAPTTSYNPTFYPSATPTASPYAANTSGRQFFYGQLAPFDVIAGFELTLPASMQAGIEAPKITVRAVDRNGNTIENYLGTIRFSSTDPDAILPNFGSYTFQARDLGVKSFALALTFRSGGTQTLRVEDSADNRIFGEESTTVSGGGSPTTGSSGINVTSHKTGDNINTLNIVVEGLGPRFSNIIVMGGVQDATGSTDELGAFSIPVTLNPAQRDFTIRVRDESGRYDSGPIILTLDQSDPDVSTVLFVPEKPEAGEQVLVVVNSDPSLASVTMNVPSVASLGDITLAENSTQAGSYQAFFTAPEAGFYQPIITVMDRAGNVTELRSTLTVGADSLSRVTGVQATSRVEAVELVWDSIPQEVDGYRIYIGDSPTNFLYTLDTDRNITRAVVRGLTPGQLYYFSITATNQGAESEEKSEPVSAQVLGLSLDVTPEDGALNVQWSTLSSNLPIATFILEYGVDEATLTEKRTLNGELRNVTVRDLLNDVTYYLRLTPVTVTGQRLDDLAATGEGTPNGDGLFSAAPRDDVPFDIVTNPGGTLHQGASVPSTGIPPIAWMSAIALGVGGVYLRWRKRQQQTRTAEFLAAVQQQYKR